MPRALMAESRQLSRIENFNNETAAPSRLLTQPRCKPRSVRVSMLATKPKAMGTRIQSSAKAMSEVMMLGSLPETAKYCPNDE